MVVKMIKWRPWPPILSKKFHVKLTIHGVRSSRPREVEEVKASPLRMRAEVRWNGRPKSPLSPVRRSIRRNLTRDVSIGEDWNEEFFAVCDLFTHKDGAFHPWEVAFTVFNEHNDGRTNKSCVLGVASLNLAEFALATEGREADIQLPLSVSCATEERPLSIHLTISLLELATKEFPEVTKRPAISILSSPISRDHHPVEKDEFSSIKAGLRKVKILKEIVSTRKSKKSLQEDEGSEGRSSSRSDDIETSSPLYMESLDGLDGESEDDRENGNIRKSFSYDSLTSANHLGRSLHTGMRINEEYEDWVYYSHRRSDVGCEVTNASSLLTLKRSILPWKKRRISFKSPKSKGETLLKDYGEAGGDDIDYDRRQMTFVDESLGAMVKTSEFGDDNFEIGRWETKEFVSRDGRAKLSTQVFFASIDQRSERAAGESACTALVVVIADWLQSNHDTMPIKSEFDRLIREGSLEWRNLCKNETYLACFPDRHFDIETILQAKVRSLSIVPEKSFIGFFHPDVIDEDSNHFAFLHGAMSFDKIWDEIDWAGTENPLVYIVSWNDHFFILKVEHDAYYIIDTLGERLYEGCQHAYILKFSEETTIQKITGLKESGSSQVQQTDEGADGIYVDVGDNYISKGKESCKEYIKSFLSALPIRELLADLKKGLMSSTPLHQLLQIDFHYIEPSMQSTVPFLMQQSEELTAPFAEFSVVTNES